MLNLEVIEPIINYRKVKYAIMDKLIQSSNMQGNRVNMFINLDTVLNRFYDPNTFSAFKSLKGKELIQITAEIFNLIAHYRNYFWTRHAVQTTFYLYYLNKKVKLCKDVDIDYLKNILEKKELEHVSYGVVNYVFKQNMSLISTISKYIKNTYFIESNGLEPTLLPYYLIKKFGESDDMCNIILSSDKIDHNLTNLQNTFILKAVGKNSKLISKDDILEYKFKPIKYRPSIDISSKLYPLIMAMIGCKERNLRTVCGFTKSCKFIEKGILSNVLKNGYNADITYFVKEYFNKDECDIIIANYKCVDTKRHYRMIKEVDEIRLTDSIVDRFDNDAIIQLNSNYFELNNIQLIELCKGVD